MEKIKEREIELLQLEFKKNEYQQSWISFKYGQNWYVDFNKVLEYNDEEWADCIESIKQAHQRAKNKIEWSDEYKLGVQSAEKRLKNIF